ncbi:MAG: HAMP domain-containing histidine kinase [Pirellulales bacterium]|nr:HAMP domain-containing histidine kinase [Pirellulales bacterium]
MERKRSLGWPITLGVIMIILLIALTIGWVLLSLAANRTISGAFWGTLVVGTIFFTIVLVGVVLYLLLTIKEINLNQRQANFIDSVTHELKSPIASLKLYLQTLRMRSVTEAQQSDFVRVMLEDVERLDALIDHLLEAARLREVPETSELADVDLSSLLTACAREACQRYRLPAEAIKLHLQPVLLRAWPIDVEIVFRNLIDNAAKYSGEQAQIEIETLPTAGGRVVTRISDNGPGIPVRLQRKIFGRFYRIGSELERRKPGTGLGLYIVDQLVRRMRGKVHVRDRAGHSGTIFEVDLPLGYAPGSQPQATAATSNRRAGAEQPQTNISPA